MIYEPCKWYKNTKRNSPLDDFIEEKSIGIPSTFCENDMQTMVVKYIQCAKLEDIEKVEPWSPQRVAAVKQWATPDNLRRLKYQEDEETGQRIIPFDAFHDMPMLSREYKLTNTTQMNTTQEKFKITDGIHRINRARELRMDCILASIEERVNIKKTDKENVEVNL